jgi:cyclopropane fatty-acyl-phospholipid synthase-like methyltransferase
VRSLRAVVVEQFGRPEGLLGRVVGLVLRFRPSNRERNRRALALLDIRPEDDVLEVGFGAGLGIERAAELANRGKVVGFDHSALMVSQARRRNTEALAAGRVELRLGGMECLSDLPIRFDKVFAINVYIFWQDQVAAVQALRGVMKPGGTIAMVVQPRNKGATNADAAAVGDLMAGSLRSAGFENVRIEIIEMAPVSTACALGEAPRA